MTGRFSSKFKEAFLGRSDYLTPPGEQMGRRRVALAGLTIFILALGVRLLHWQDIRSEQLTGESIATTLVDHYQQEALRIASEVRTLIP